MVAVSPGEGELGNLRGKSTSGSSLLQKAQSQIPETAAAYGLNTACGFL